MVTMNKPWTKLAGIFRGKLDPRRILEELQLQGEELRRVSHGLEYDRRVLENRLEVAMQKGVNAVRSGKSMQESEAAMEVRLIRTEGAALQRDHATVLKALHTCRVAAMKVKSAASGGSVQAVKRIKILFEDSRFQSFLTGATVREEQFREYLEKELEYHADGLESRNTLERIDLESEREAFQACAQAEDQGDLEAVSRIRSEIIAVPDSCNAGLEDALID